MREGAARAPIQRMSDEIPSVAEIPPMPHHAEEVEQWLIDRNFELRSALHHQDTSMIAHIGAFNAKSASKLSISGRTSRSSLMAALNAKRRCVEANPFLEEEQQEVESDGEKTLKERCACPWMG